MINKQLTEDVFALCVEMCVCLTKFLDVVHKNEEMVITIHVIDYLNLVFGQFDE